MCERESDVSVHVHPFVILWLCYIYKYKNQMKDRDGKSAKRSATRYCL